MKEYQKDAILKYGCSKGFKIREGIPRCSKFGWTLKPECDGNAPLLLHNKRIIWEIIQNPSIHIYFIVRKTW